MVGAQCGEASASNFFTPLVRTCPVGTARFSSRVDVEAARAAILSTRARRSFHRAKSETHH